MIIGTTYLGQHYSADLSQPIDLSIPIGDVKCFGAPDVAFEPYREGAFVGSVQAGAPVNFFNVRMNPHGNGTHTECQGHITARQETIHDALKAFHFVARLISVTPRSVREDLVITQEQIASAVAAAAYPEALIIRTLPNDLSKLSKDYTGTNPPYLEVAAMDLLVDSGVKHLLLDLPSVDRERDEGKLSAHHRFWNLTGEAPPANRLDCTITELIYVHDAIKDGLYLLNIQIPSLRLDAAPSKPVLYQLIKSEN